MKHLSLLFLILTVSLTAKDNPVLQMNAQQYEKLADTIVRAYVQKGQVPTPDEILRVRTLEHQMLALCTLNPALSGQLPPLYLTLFEIKDLRSVPAQILAERLRRSGLDPLKDRVAGRFFQLAGTNP
jgi:hypothetical protein